MLPSQAVRAGLRASTYQFRRSVVLDGIRTYAAATQNVKPPVALYGIDGTYANALVRHFPKSGTIPLRSPRQSTSPNSHICRVVHRRRKNLCPRTNLQGSSCARGGLQKGPKAHNHPQCTNPVSERQEADYPGATKGVWV